VQSQPATRCSLLCGTARAVGAALVALLLAGTAAAQSAGQPIPGDPGEVSLAPPERLTQPAEDLAALCLRAVERSSRDDAAWCDVEIETLNRKLDRTGAEDVELVAAYNNRAILNTRDQRFELAEADMAAALALAPSRPELMITRGNLRMAQGRFADALTDYSLAIERSGGSQPAFFVNRALALRALGEVAAAAADAQRAGLSPTPARTAASPAAGSR